MIIMKTTRITARISRTITEIRARTNLEIVLMITITTTETRKTTNFSKLAGEGSDNGVRAFFG